MLTSDLDAALSYTLDVLRPRAADSADADWDAPAGELEWSCWQTAEHLADTLFVYALQFTPRPPELDTGRNGYLPVSELTMERRHGPLMLLHLLDGSGGLLSRAVRTTDPGQRMRHFHQLTDPAGFVAMGTVETLAHGWDLAGGLGVRDAWNPPADLCERALSRLFPGLPPGLAEEAGAWPTLLWAVGRTELPGRPRRQKWRWDPRIPAER
jgi:hypothetical protein